MPSTDRAAAPIRAALLLAVVIATLVAATGTAGAQTASLTTPAVYRLNKDSTYPQGCFAPCLCPVMTSSGAKGTLILTPAGFDGLFTNYAVTEVNWLISLNGTDTFVTGSGTYKIGGEVAVQQELSLDLKVGDNAVQHFDSGLVGATTSFPDLDVTISINNQTCFDTVFHVSASPVPPDQIRPYRLVAGSTFQRGCTGACACAVGQKLPLAGTFALVPLASTPPWNEFAVINVRWRALDPSATGLSSSIPVRGAGEYAFGGDFALQQRMNLILKVDKDDPAHFDSGLVPGGGFPRIDVRISIAGATCFDTIMDIHAEPRKALFHRSTRTDGDS
ncbi:MAG: hypothetical protein AUH92_05930 [Acidobacteria bacterium 13_1_40CM_4_69_4]|nr:MAG: hypothetical protein AUH92_05930 [Acidobacteria bacterium 13_1_40CM_4_69_4]